MKNKGFLDSIVTIILIVIVVAVFVLAASIHSIQKDTKEEAIERGYFKYNEDTYKVTYYGRTDYNTPKLNPFVEKPSDTLGVKNGN